MPAPIVAANAVSSNHHFARRDACPACGAAGASVIFTRPYSESKFRVALESSYAEVGRLDYTWLAGAEYTLDRCHRCGLIFQRNVPDDRLLAELYEVWIQPGKSFERLHARVPIQRRLEIARDVFIGLSLATNAGSPARALDYGCGWGEWAMMTRAFGAEAWGTELSPTRSAFCTKLGINVVPESDLPAGHFDFINADQVFEHLPQPRKNLALLVEKLRPNGVMRIAVPNGLLVPRALGRFDRELSKPILGRLNPVAPLEHLNCFTCASLLTLGASCHLQRVLPPWRILWSGMNAPPGLKAKAKSLVRPFYLRSRQTTQLFFRRTEA